MLRRVLSGVLFVGVVTTLGTAVTLAGEGCGVTPKDITSAVVRIADDVCKEESGTEDAPAWVQLACAVEGGIVHVRMPRAEWGQIRARHFDAGPGR